MEEELDLRLMARERSRAALRATLPEERAAWSAAIRRTFVESALFKAAETVLLFAAQRYEPDLVPLLTDSSAAGKRLVFPRVDAADRMTAHLVHTPDQLVTGPLRFREPASECPEANVCEIDLIAVPGLCFTISGARLGRGRGHYDRFLSQPGCRAALTGVCFSAQIFPALPIEPHDVLMHHILTESGWLLLPESTAPEDRD